MSDFKYFLLLAIAGYFITKIATKNTKYETYAETNETSSNFGIKWVIGIIVVAFFVLFLSLSYHFIPSRSLMFPKETLSLSNTIIEESDVQKLIDRYNNASLFEQQAINQEPLVRKLKEKGIIYDKKREDD